MTLITEQALWQGRFSTLCDWFSFSWGTFS